jgi:hypothetical protein
MPDSNNEIFLSFVFVGNLMTLAEAVLYSVEWWDE